MEETHYLRPGGKLYLKAFMKNIRSEFYPFEVKKVAAVAILTKKIFITQLPVKR
jgi:hypothetical protein